MEVCHATGEWVVWGASLLSVAFGASMAAQAGRPPEPDVLNALLTEVRGLRQAMEQMAVAGPRVQLALGRLQLQEQRVNTMIRRLETVREAAAKAEKEVATAESSLAPALSMFGIDKDAPDEKDGGHQPRTGRARTRVRQTVARIRGGDPGTRHGVTSRKPLSRSHCSTSRRKSS